MGISSRHWRVEALDETALAQLAGCIAPSLGHGDVLALHGDLGSGKTSFARALIRALSDGGDGLEVPSPTFTLVQTYETRVPVTHFDLYRIEAQAEIAELGFDDALAESIVLVEWPDRLGRDLPADRLDVEITSSDDANLRDVTLTGHGAWAKRIERLHLIADFLEQARHGDWRRTFLQGDASSRRYERLIADDGRRAVLMDMPPRPGSDEAAYSRQVHLAEGVLPFVAMARALRNAGLNAPEIFAADIANGLLLIEDFGDRVFGSLDPDGSEIETAYTAACDVLVHLAHVGFHNEIALADGGTYRVPDYDRNAMHTETALLTEWFWPHLGRPVPAADECDRLRGIWDNLFDLLSDTDPVWIMRDYHSPNLMWLPGARGTDRIGLLDFQDAVMGPAAFDLASLLQDARIDVAPAREAHYLNYYLDARSAANAAFDRVGFLRDYAILGAQRATKILGIFARLNARDGKPGYLRHLPRVSDYLERNLRHPDLADLRAWFDAHLPHDMRAGGVG